MQRSFWILIIQKPIYQIEGFQEIEFFYFEIALSLGITTLRIGPRVRDGGFFFS